MIIVEGPDNSGKSTLVKQLAKDLDLIIYKGERGPCKDSGDLIERTTNMLLKYGERRSIADRCPLIGESIYGPILRNHDLWSEEKPVFNLQQSLFLEALRTGKLILIYCRPPDDIVLNFSNHQVKEYDTADHLKELESKKSEVVKAYDRLIPVMCNLTYDYTKQDSYKNLLETLRKEYCYECK